MPAPDLVLLTRLIPPRVNRRVLARPHLRRRVLEALDYRLTIVQAGTGYGKTTALADLQESAAPLLWYTLDASDRDAQQFLAYLIASFRLHLPEVAAAPQALLGEMGTGSSVSPQQVIDALINALAAGLHAPTLLVLDDFHLVEDAPDVVALFERLLTFMPPDLHVILATWRTPTFPGLSLPAWRTRGDLLELSRADLAFGRDETADLLRQGSNESLNLSADEIAHLHNKTEGWPIVVQLIRQGLRSGGADGVRALLDGSEGSSPPLFDALAGELLRRQAPEIAHFLRETAVLVELTPAACDAVRRDPESGASGPLLKQLHAADLFVVALGEEHYRYHHLFHDFLRAQTANDPVGTRARHRRAATWFLEQGEGAEAIPHWLAAREFDEAANAIAGIGEAVLQAGRLNRLADWIDALPPDILAERPRLQALLGDIYRLRSHFDGALAWYTQAERTWRARDDAAGASRALRGQALVYLDTVRSAEAEELLQEALRLADGTPDRQARARLLLLMAENKLNQGKPDEAQALRRQAEALRAEAPDDEMLDTRVKLRTGRLQEARDALENLAAAEQRAARSQPQAPIGPPRAHRETVLVLSLVDSMMGQFHRAWELAREGIALGKRLDSPFITAVGYMRLGHALQLGAGGREPSGVGGVPPGRARAANYAEAAGNYRSAIALGDSLAVRRTRAEAMWGLTRAYGHSGDLEMALASATECVEISSESGDVWLMALARLALGASYVLAGQIQAALPVLGQALAAFRECHDLFGRAAARLWMALAWLELLRRPAAGNGADSGAQSLFEAAADEVLSLCAANNYDFLFTGPSLLGPPDERRLIPLLLEARVRNIHPAYVTHLLQLLGLADLRLHPGFQLRVRTLGAFRVWRGDEEIEGRQWQRDKARQLFQLLLSERSPALGLPATLRERVAEGAGWAEHGRGHWLQRSQIVERLWPHLEPEAAVRDFKVALNAVVRALEPETGPGTGARAFFFIEREGSAYRLRADADLWLDAAEFEALCRRGLRGPADSEAVAALRAALSLYADDYLPEALYEDWAAAERERLRMLYLRAADRLASVLVEQGGLDEALEICTAILARDNCWEHAWQLMISIHLQRDNRVQARRVYDRCVEVLREELDVPPSDETQELQRAIGG